MIVHTVLFQPRQDLPADARLAILDATAAAARDIPGVSSFRVGRRVLHGLPGYEQAMQVPYEFAMFVEVETIDALKAYLTHPAHLALGAHFTLSAASALAYDYALVDAADATRLAG